MNIEIVSHCWHYGRLLRYQLSSLLLHRVHDASVRMTVFHDSGSDDDETRRVLEFFANQSWPPNVQLHPWPLERPRLLRRAIGRNQAALKTTADLVWFADCDMVFGDACLDKLVKIAPSVDGPLMYPRHVHVTSQARGDEYIDAATGSLELLSIDHSDFSVPKRYRRAIGGAQIAKGDVVRAKGYCRRIRRYQRPQLRWRQTHEDQAFRRSLGTRGTPHRTAQHFSHPPLQARTL